MRISRGSLDGLKAELRNRVDAEAELARASVITLGAGQAMVYEQKRREADAIMAAIAAGDQVNPWDVPLLSVEAADLGTDLQGAATAVIIAANQWTQIGALIEQKRLGHKRAIDAAPDADAARAAATVDWSLPL